MKRILVFTTMILLIGVISASAEAPKTLSYQGVLHDGAGGVVADGDYNLTFKIYDGESSSSSIWQQGLVAAVQGGIFSVILGPVDLAFDKPYWLGVTLQGSSEFLPRRELTTSPYSFSSKLAETVVPSSVGQNEIADGNVVRSLNGKTDHVDLLEGSGVTITPVGNNLEISSTGGAADEDWVISGPDMHANVAGNVGIGTAAPTHKLEVGGDVFAVNSATSGPGGHFEIDQPGNTDPALVARHIGTGPAALLDGTVNVGDVTHNDGDLRVFRNGVPTYVMGLRSDEWGGRIDAYDESGNPTGKIEADGDGTGGFLTIYSDVAETGVVIDGNYLGSHDPRLTLHGNSTIGFASDLSGNSAVQLPNNAIADTEILDEPGAVSANYDGPGFELTGNLDVLLTQTITAPTGGFALVIATGDVYVGKAVSTLCDSYFWVADQSSTKPTTQVYNVRVDTDPLGSYVQPVTVHGLFEITAGSHTFYFMADDFYGGVKIYSRQLTVVFLPTAYGTVQSPAASVSAVPGEDGPTAPALSEADIAAIRAKSEADNTARIQRELDEMQEQIRRLREELAAARGKPRE